MIQQSSLYSIGKVDIGIGIDIAADFGCPVSIPIPINID